MTLFDWTPLLALFMGTLALEDAALAYGLTLIQLSSYPIWLIAVILILGISLGDIMLYALGKIPSWYPKTRWTKNLVSIAKDFQVRHKKNLTTWIIISRAIPGSRLPTYIYAGFSDYPFFRFLILTASSVFAWVILVILIGELLPNMKDLSLPLIFISLFIFIRFAGKTSDIVFNSHKRKILFYSLRKYLYFEFWPSWLFYMPVVPIYTYLALRYRSFFLPFYVNPTIRNGGLVGESKWDFLKYFSSGSGESLKTQKYEFLSDSLVDEIQNQNFKYPFILKPDIGQRGFAVRIIKNPTELIHYCQESKFDLIQQELCTYKNEVGLFYIRLPWQSQGSIFSITNKKFPFIVGDGTRTVQELIFADPRARMISSIYFERHKDRLDEVLQQGQKLMLTECGNHCQGTIFLNGSNLNTEALTKKIDAMAKMIPDFYFGRFDIRYQDEASLQIGRNLKVIEINGAGSEATHIWDRKTKLLEAYITLYKQWDYAFQIGRWIKDHEPEKICFNPRSFLKDVFSLLIRKNKLARSS